MTKQTVTAETINTDKLAEAGDRLANVLNAHNVFWYHGNPKHDAYEREAFTRGLVGFATSDDIRSYYEVTFTSCVRLIITVDVVEGAAKLRTVEAFDHPWPNEAINYEALNADLLAVLNDLNS